MRQGSGRMAAERALIGLLDTSCRASHLTPTNSKIGGLPDFYQSCTLAAPPVCKLCASALYLLAQVYCPHEGSPYHRLLHIFCCAQLRCQYNSESWVVLRSQEREALVVAKKLPENPAKGKWCEEEDDWGTPPREEQSNVIGHKNEDASNLTGQELMLSSLSLDGTGSMATTVIDHSQTPCFPSWYIQVIEEPLEFHDSKELVRKAVDSVNNCSSSSEVYEKTTTKHGDKTFYKFHKRLSRCPEQVLRYQWDGTPILITDKTSPPNPSLCQHCRAPRVFELQLMPPLVYLLRTSSGVDVEFGTVLVYTCSKSCWHDKSSAREEYIYVQSQPEDLQLMKWS